MVPALLSVYEMVGLGETLGEGLELGNPSVDRGAEGGIDFILLKGSITNLTDDEKSVPLIKAFLTNADGEEIQSVVQEPPAAMIGPPVTAATATRPAALAALPSFDPPQPPT